MSKPWYKKNWLAIALLVLLPPIGIVLTWLTDWRRQRKVIATGLGLLWWLILAAGTGDPGTSPQVERSQDNSDQTESVAEEAPSESVAEELPSEEELPEAGGESSSASNTEPPAGSDGDLYEIDRIIDGDTLSAVKDGDAMRIRLACIDAPESNQVPHGRLSANRLSSLVGERVRLNIVDEDRYGRPVAEVYSASGKLFVNLQMVASGDALVYRQYLQNCEDRARALVAAEERASAQGLGVWGDSSFVMPWDYRDGKRAAETRQPNDEPVVVEEAEPTPTPTPEVRLPDCVESDCNCSDFTSWRQAQDVLEAYSGDPHRLDGDKDGIACESLQ